MQALDGTTLDPQAAWERMFNPVAAEVRTAGDRPTPYVHNRAKPVRGQKLVRNRAATDASSDHGETLSTSIPVSDVDRTFFDPWFSRTMELLAAAREPAAPDAKERAAIIDTAEMLAAFLSEVDPSFRPQLMVDEDGNASYGTSVEDYYLNLTIDLPGKITWYAVVDNKEYFEESAPFNGRNLPKLLRNVLQLPTA
ncbi:hypothetical protein ACFZ8E_14790 [Methylobacterium sp. HMF5984]|uniref:hypothetical protein n=1 Tax=Methylobacterium sp. HMF5984 TaxID=3367370 RepID=UPI003854E631